MVCSPRKFFVGGNFKMNPTSFEQLRTLVTTLTEQQVPSPDLVETVVAPPSLYLLQTRDILKAKGSSIKVAAQNLYHQPKGAFTGEIGSELLLNDGINYVILGHSERRTLFGETDELIATKTAFAVEKGFTVILCIGETLEQRESNQTFDVVQTQIKAHAPGLDWSKIVIAYEPVWAIGTGKVATTAQAQEVHAEIRRFLQEHTGSEDIARKTRIIYGGSVKEGNCVDLAAEADIDGFLVGGASLEPTFGQIISARENLKLKQQQ